MKRSLFFLVLCLFVCGSAVQAQRKKVTKPRSPKYTLAPYYPEPLMPEIRDFAFVISLDSAGAAGLSVRSSRNSPNLTPGELKRFLAGSKPAGAKSNTAMNSSIDPIVIIEPHFENKLGSIIDLVQTARVSYTPKIKVRVSGESYVFVPRLLSDEDLISVKPNPLFLVVNVDSRGVIRLNNEEQGVWPDLSRLQELLRMIFRDREINGVFREGTNLVETMIFVRMPLSTRWSDTSVLINALRASGSDLIGLQVDDLEQ